MSSVSEKSSADKKAGACRLVLTGRRSKSRYRIFLNGHVLDLPAMSYQALIALVVAHAARASGLTEISCRTAYRLRRAFDTALGPGVGERLIINGAGEEYRLAIPHSEFSKHCCQHLERT